MRHAPWAAVGLLILAGSPAIADDAPCKPGHKWVEVDSYTEVVRYVCKVVPDVKKVRKVNYSTKDDPFCLPNGCLKELPVGCATDAEGCATCKGPYMRKILVKTEVVCEEPTVKCVVERVVERVPCKVKQMVPCGPVTVGSATAVVPQSGPGPLLPAPRQVGK